jgi:MHS family proline/betaine transporter-like MFS transporter
VISLPEREKYRALPWSLAHIALNNFFYIWSFGGTVFLLYLNELDLPKDQIGVLLSFFPFTGLLALVLGPAVARWGRKRVYLLCFGIRKPVMFLLILLPWLQQRLGTFAAVAFLFAVILTVAVLRAVAETGYYPWLQEFVPNAVRGKFGAASTILLTLTSVIAVFFAGQALEHFSLASTFNGLLTAGVAIGIIGVGMMLFVPGGKPVLPPVESSRLDYVSSLADTLRDRNYLYFLGGMGCYTLGVYMFSSFLPLYLKEQLGLLPAAIVRLDIAAMIGGALFSLVSGVIADRLGSRPVLMPGLAASVLVPAGWLFVPAHTSHAFVLSALLYFSFGAASVSASIAATRSLFNSVIPLEKNTAYTSVYYAWAGLTGGIAPLLGGSLLTSLVGWQIGAGFFSLDAFRLLFLISLVSFIGSVFLYGKVSSDSEVSTRSALRKFFKRKLPPL